MNLDKINAERRRKGLPALTRHVPLSRIKVRR